MVSHSSDQTSSSGTEGTEDRGTGIRRSCLRESAIERQLITNNDRTRRSVTFAPTTSVLEYRGGATDRPQEFSTEDKDKMNTGSTDLKPQDGGGKVPVHHSPPNKASSGASAYFDYSLDDSFATPILPPININRRMDTSSKYSNPPSTSAKDTAPSIGIPEVHSDPDRQANMHLHQRSTSPKVNNHAETFPHSTNANNQKINGDHHRPNHNHKTNSSLNANEEDKGCDLSALYFDSVKETSSNTETNKNRPMGASKSQSGHQSMANRSLDMTDDTAAFIAEAQRALLEIPNLEYQSPPTNDNSLLPRLDASHPMKTNSASMSSDTNANKKSNMINVSKEDLSSVPSTFDPPSHLRGDIFAGNQASMHQPEGPSYDSPVLSIGQDDYLFEMPDISPRTDPCDGPFAPSPKLLCSPAPLLSSAGRGGRRRSTFSAESSIEFDDVGILTSPGPAPGIRILPKRNSMDIEDMADYQRWLQEEAKMDRECQENPPLPSVETLLNSVTEEEQTSQTNEIVEPPYMNRFGPGNPVSWTTLIIEAGLPQQMLQRTLDLSVLHASEESNGDNGMREEKKFLWEMSTDDLRYVLDPQKRFIHSDICDYYPFIKKKECQKMNAVVKNYRDIECWSDDEVKEFMHNFAGFQAHLEVLTEWAQEQKIEYEHILMCTSTTDGWQEHVPACLMLSEAFNRCNEHFLLTEGKQVTKLEDVAPFGRCDTSLRRWTSSQDLCAQIPPTSENLAANSLLQAIIDRGVDADQTINTVVEALRERIKEHKTIYDARFDATILTKIAIRTKNILRDNTTRLLAHARSSASKAKKDKKVAIKYRKSGRQLIAEREKKAAQKAQREELNALIHEEISASKRRLAEEYSTELKAYASERKALSMLLNDSNTIIMHAKVQHLALTEWLPTLVHQQEFWDFRLYYARCRIEEHDLTDFSFSWNCYWNREHARLLGPEDLIASRRSDALSDLEELGHRLSCTDAPTDQLIRLVQAGNKLLTKGNAQPELNVNQLLMLIDDKGFDPRGFEQSFQEINSLSHEIQKALPMVNDYFQSHVKGVHRCLRQMAIDRKAVMCSVLEMTNRSRLGWPNAAFGPRAKKPPHRCSMLMVWNLDERDPMLFEDRRLKAGTCYQGVRLCIQGACRDPARWCGPPKKATKGAFSTQVFPHSILTGTSRIEIDAAYESRFLYIVESVANHIAFRLNNEKNDKLSPFPSPIIDTEEVTASSNTTLALRDTAFTVARTVSTLIASMSWLQRDLRAVIDDFSFDQLTYRGCPIAPFTLSKNDSIYIRTKIGSEPILTRYQSSHPAIHTALAVGYFYVHVKCDVTKAIIHGGRILYGINDIFCRYRSMPTRLVFDGIDQIEQVAKSIESVLRDQLKSEFFQNSSGQRQSDHAFDYDMVPTHLRIAANEVDKFTFTLVLSEALAKIFSPSTG